MNKATLKTETKKKAGPTYQIASEIGYWLINKYDALNRLTQNYLALNSYSRARNQDSCTNNINYPAVNSVDLMQENYYDSYSWASGKPGVSTTISAGDIWGAFFFTTYNAAPDYSQQITPDYSRAVGKLTGSKVRVFGTSTYLYSVNFYDIEGRVIQTRGGDLTSGSFHTVTTQYDFSGRPLRVLYRQEKGSPVARYIRELTKYSYDHAGRVTSVKVKLGQSGADHTVAENTYDELGRLETKDIGGLETQNYEYNIRGWLLGANRGYIKGDSIRKFGYELGYDDNHTIMSGSEYAHPQYNGNIEGTIWKSAGDGEVRSMDYNYDAANRLIAGDFNQYTSGSFNKGAGMDFSVSNLSYDANGNIQTMTQRGWKLRMGKGLRDLPIEESG